MPVQQIGTPLQTSVANPTPGNSDLLFKKQVKAQLDEIGQRIADPAAIPPVTTLASPASGGQLTLSGVLTAASAHVTGNEQVDGNLTVNGTLSAKLPIPPASITILDSGRVSRTGPGTVNSVNTVNPGSSIVFLFMGESGAAGVSDIALSGWGLSWSRLDAVFGANSSALFVGTGSGSAGVLTFTITGGIAAGNTISFIAVQGAKINQSAAGETGADVAFASVATETPTFSVAQDTICDPFLCGVVSATAADPGAPTAGSVTRIASVTGAQPAVQVFVGQMPTVILPVSNAFPFTLASAVSRRAHWARLKYTG